MKFFAIFATLLAVSAAAYSPVSTWTLQQIEAALQDPTTNPDHVPYLINGMNKLMAMLWSGAIKEPSIVLSLPFEESVTLDQITAAIHDPKTHPAVLPYYEEALNELMTAMFNGEEKHSIVLDIPAMTVSMWTLHELSEALENPATDPELMIYLEYALNQHMAELFAGSAASAVVVVTPPGVIISIPETPVIAVQPEPETPVIAVQPEPETPVIAVQPETAGETPAPASPSAPLVQLIININANKQQENAVAPTPVGAGEGPVGPSPAGWAPVIVEPVGPTPIGAGEGPVGPSPAGWAPVIVEPIAPEQQGPVLAVGPWA